MVAAAGKRLVVLAHAGLADDDARAADGVGKHLLVGGQLEQIGPDGFRQIGIVLGDAVGRKPVRLGEDHVEGDVDGAHRRQPVDQPGDLGARPGPLADLFEALFVYVDDDDGLFDVRARIEPLEDVEALVADGRDEKRVGDAQGRAAPASSTSPARRAMATPMDPGDRKKRIR